MDQSTRRRAFLTAALTAALALWTSGAPSVVYPLYDRDWHLPSVVTTAVFAAYPVALIVTLGLFGHAGDVLGRRRSIVAGLAAMGLGTIAFAIAPDVWWLFAGRVVSGVGVGLAFGSATAALADFARPGREGATGAVTAAATAFGLTAALLVGGALVQFAPDSLHLSFWVLLLVIAATLVLATRLPASARTERLRPHLPVVPRRLRIIVIRGALAVSTAYASGAVVLALGANIAVDLVHTAQPAVIGVLLAISSVTIGVSAILARRVAPRILAVGGVAATLLGFAALVAAALGSSVVAFLAAMVVSGIGYSLLFSAGVGIVATSAPQEHRAATISLVYLIAYAVQAVTAVGLGAIATATGLAAAVVVAAIGIGILALAAGALALSRAAAREDAARERAIEGSAPAQEDDPIAA
jgi:predicted MFS family arabinose efflux permease